jgi:hypothetical protein
MRPLPVVESRLAVTRRRVAERPAPAELLP